MLIELAAHAHEQAFELDRKFKPNIHFDAIVSGGPRSEEGTCNFFICSGPVLNSCQGVHSNGAYFTGIQSKCLTSD